MAIHFVMSSLSHFLSTHFFVHRCRLIKICATAQLSLQQDHCVIRMLLCKQRHFRKWKSEHRKKKKVIDHGLSFRDVFSLAFPFDSLFCSSPQADQDLFDCAIVLTIGPLCHPDAFAQTEAVRKFEKARHNTTFGVEKGTSL